MSLLHNGPKRNRGTLGDHKDHGQLHMIIGDHIGHLGDHKKPYDIMGFEEFRGKLSVREL